MRKTSIIFIIFVLFSLGCLEGLQKAYSFEDEPKVMLKISEDYVVVRPSIMDSFFIQIINKDDSKKLIDFKIYAKNTNLLFGPASGNIGENPYQKETLVYSNQEKEFEIGVLAKKNTPDGKYVVNVLLEFDDGEKIRDSLQLEVNYKS